MLATIKKNTPSVSQCFQGAAVITTAGSVMGTFHGIAPSLSTSLAGLISLSLGVVTYATINYAWNHTGSMKRVAAAVIAAVGLSVSVWTIDLGAQANQAAQISATSSARQSTLSAEQAILDDKDAALKSDLKSQLNRLMQADEADRADAALLRTDVRKQISELQKANDADLEQIKAYQALIKRHTRPKTNGANVRKTQTAIDRRNGRIDRLNREIKTISKDLDGKLATRETQANKLVNQLAIPAPIAAAKAAPGNAEKPAKTNTIIHSSLLDIFSVIFLFLSFLYRREVSGKDTLEVVDTSTEYLDTLPVSTIENKQSVDAYPTVEHLLPDSRAIFDQPETAEKIKPVTLNETETLEQLRSHQIAANSHGRITITLIREVTGWGYAKAKRFLENDCTEAGVLDAHSNGSGLFFTYPQVPAATDNVLSLVNGGKS